jgi:hypothetical protein
LKPVLVLTPSKGGAPGLRKWRIRILPCLPEETFKVGRADERQPQKVWHLTFPTTMNSFRDLDRIETV